MSAVFPLDLDADQGSQFGFTSTPWVVAGVIQNLTGGSCAMNIAVNPYDTTARLALTSTPNVNGSSVVENGTAGTVTITITAADLALLPSNLGPLLYQLFVTVSGVPTLLLSGRFFLSEELP